MKNNNVKGYVISFVCGAIMMVSTQSFAAVGDKIEAIFAEFNLVVNGQPKAMDETPLVYNGTSYLPVRSIANIVGFDVTYKADSRTIELTKGTVIGDTYGGGTTRTTPVVDTQIYYYLNEISLIKPETDISVSGKQVEGKLQLVVTYKERNYIVDPNSNYYYDRSASKGYYTEAFLLQFLSKEDLSVLTEYTIDRASKAVLVR